MRYQVDHDYHLHSFLSLCSSDPEQTAARMLAYAEENGLKELCMTDHFWDDAVPGSGDWYGQQNYAHILASLPLPQSDKVHFYFGCETELNKAMTLAITKETIDKLDFVIIPTTHFHMFTVENDSHRRRAELWLERFYNVLNRDLPFEKIGIAHLTCPLFMNSSWQDHIDAINAITDDEMHAVFAVAAQKGVGIELNLPDLDEYSPEGLEAVLRPYKIAKEEKNRFYFGSDAHHPAGFANCVKKFNDLVDLLALTEDDRFRING